MIVLGLEATIWTRRAPGSGRIAFPGNSHFGQKFLGTQDNQTIMEEVKTASHMTSPNGDGMMAHAQTKNGLYAARRFAQVTLEHSTIFNHSWRFSP